MKSLSIELTEVTVHKCSKKRCFQNIGGIYKKTLTAKYKFRLQSVIWLLCPQALKPKNAQENWAFDVLYVHMYVFCKSISCLFSSGMKLGVKQCRDITDFALHCFLRVSLFLFYIYQNLGRKPPYKKLLKILWL